MTRLRRFLRFLFSDFGPLIAFWASYLGAGLRAAIAATVVYVVGDFIHRYRYGLRGIMHMGVVSGLIGVREIEQYGTLETTAQ